MKMGTRRQRSGRILLAAAAGLWLASGEGIADERGRAQTEPALERPLSQPVIQMTSVTGTIATIGDDAAGLPHAVGIVSPEQRIYLVGNEGIGKDLKELVGKTVTVAAVVKRDIDGWPYLAVEWYRVLEG